MSQLVRRTRSKSKQVDLWEQEDTYDDIILTENQCIDYFKKYNIIGESIRKFSDIDLKKFKSAYRKSTRLFHPDKKKPEERSKFEKVFEQMEMCKEMVNVSFKNILSEFFESIYNADQNRLSFARSVFYSHWVHEGVENKKMDNFRAVVFLEFIVVMKRYLNDGNKQIFLEESKRLSKLFFSSDIRRYFLPEGSKSAKAIVSLSTTAVVIHNWVFRKQLDFYVNDIIRTTSIILDISTNNFVAIPGMAQKIAAMYSRIKNMGFIFPGNMVSIENILSLIVNTNAVDEFLNTNSFLQGFNSFSSFVKENLGVDLLGSQVGYGQEAIIEAGVKGIEQDIKEINLYIQMYIFVGIVLFVFVNAMVAFSNYRAYSKRVKDISAMVAEITGDSNEQNIEANIKQLLEEGVTSPTKPMIRRLSSESLEDIMSPKETIEVDLATDFLKMKL